MGNVDIGERIYFEIFDKGRILKNKKKSVHGKRRDETLSFKLIGEKYNQNE